MYSSEMPFADLRVLIVEDQPLLALAIEDFLTILGCSQFTSTSNAKAALLALAAFRPDLALLDINLDDRGPRFDVADALVSANIPFIFASGADLSAIPQRHRHRPFVRKPFTEADLAPAIRRALDVSVAEVVSPQ